MPRTLLPWSGVTLLVFCALPILPLPPVAAIEVHEDVNEVPIREPLHLNASKGPEALDSGPPPTATVNERSVDDPAPYRGQNGGHGANNFTTLPSNHQPHSGAGPTSAPLTTEVVTVGSVTVASTGITSFPSRAPPTTAGLSSFRGGGHPYSGRAASTGIVSDRAVQHQISGYRKRQLYASAAPRRNATEGVEGQFQKEFVPSPEVVPFFHEENTAPGGPTAGSVDASFPTGSADGDSRWYAGAGLTGLGYGRTSPGSATSEESGKWNHKYTWTTPSQRPQQNVVKFPQEPTPHFPSPKGKWKWIPEEEQEATPPAGSKKPAESPFSSSGSFEEQNFAQHPFTFATPSKNHPYSFDRTPIEGSVEPVASVNGSGSAESNETSNGGSTDAVKLAGKEDAHLKSVSPWKKIIHVLSAAIPIGLLISALTPQVVYINPNATQPPIQLQTPTPVSGGSLPPLGLRQRSLTPGQDSRFLLAQRGLGSDPVALVKLLQTLNALERTESSPGHDDTNHLPESATGHGCDWKLLCQLAHRGMSPPSAAAVQKMLWKIINETPPTWTGRLGLDETFRLIRDGDCERLPHTCDPRGHLSRRT